MARRGVGGGAPGGPEGPERGLPELLRVDHGKAEGPEGRAAPLPVQERPAGSRSGSPRTPRFRVLGNGRLRLPKVGDVEVRWSRDLPAAPIVGHGDQGRGGPVLRVVRRRRPAGLHQLPETANNRGVRDRPRHRPDFAVLERRHQDRRAEVPAARGEETAGAVGAGRLSRKQKGSANRDKARVKVARAHAHVTDARRDFHHKLSTAIIRDSQAVYVEDLYGGGGWRGRGWRSRWATRAGRRWCRYWSTRRRCTAGTSAGSAGGADVAGLLGLRGQGRPEAAERPGVDVRSVRGRPRP